jgi:parvulin-like peptidyl-prolyl cis-trans isomerase-like protein
VKTRRFIVLIFLAACGSRREHVVAPAPVEEHFQGPFSPPPARDAEVVARVNDEAIYAADVERQARGRGQTPAQAVAELIDAELLAQEARRRGLADSPEAILARKQERVRLLVKREFEPSFAGPRDVPAEEVEAALRDPRNRGRFDHPEYHTVVFARADVPPAASPEVEAQARRAAEALWLAATVSRPRDDEQFAQLAMGVERTLGVGLPRQIYSTTEHHGPAVPDFAAAAFTVHEVGDVSRPLRTKWGWDVLFLSAIIPERHATAAEADAELRHVGFEPSRRAGFLRWADGYVRRHQVVRFDDVLGKIDVDSLVGLP